MIDLLIKVVVAILFLFVTYFLSSLLLPHPFPTVLTVVVACLLLIYLLRGRSSL